MLRAAIVVSVSLFAFSALAKESPVQGDENVFVSGGASLQLAAGMAIPSGYYALCMKGSPVCAPSSGRLAKRADGAVRLTKRLAFELVSVNRDVNRRIRPMSDLAQYGVADRWSVSPKAGDCEDYALTKKADLLKAGWPSSALLIALAVTKRGEQHAVLVVRTDHGDFVLDNLVADVRSWTPKLYRWTSIQSPDQEWAWNKVSTKAVMVAAAGPLPDDVPAIEVASNAPAAGLPNTPEPSLSKVAGRLAKNLYERLYAAISSIKVALDEPAAGRRMITDRMVDVSAPFLAADAASPALGRQAALEPSLMAAVPLSAYAAAE
jgi:predicted transglutaminase-like cysteine proteinase